MHAEHDLDLEDTPFSRQSPGTATSPVAEAAERLKQAAGDNAKRLRNAAEAGFRTFRDTSPEPAANDGSTAVAAPNWDELRAKAKELHREGEAWARENPTAAVAIAAGAGFVLGLLLKR